MGTNLDDDEELDHFLQLETMKWRSMVAEIEELLGGFSGLGEKLESQASRLATRGEETVVVEGMSELEANQEAMIQARIKSSEADSSQKKTKKDDINSLRQELAKLDGSQHPEDSARGDRAVRKQGSASDDDSDDEYMFGSPSPLSSTQQRRSSLLGMSGFGVPQAPLAAASSSSLGKQRLGKALQTVRTIVRKGSQGQGAGSSSVSPESPRQRPSNLLQESPRICSSALLSVGKELLHMQ